MMLLLDGRNWMICYKTTKTHQRGNILTENSCHCFHNATQLCAKLVNKLIVQTSKVSKREILLGSKFWVENARKHYSLNNP